MRKYLRNTLTGAALLAGTMLGATAGLAGGIPSIPPTPPFNDASQIVSTLNQFIQSLNGLPTAIAPTPGVVAFGQFCAANAAGTSITCNGQRGAVIFQGQASLAAGGATIIQVVNSAVTANSTCMVTFGGQNVAAGSGVVIAGSTAFAGALNVTVLNPTATATGASGLWSIQFNCIN
jgi:hypothetical protein